MRTQIFSMEMILVLFALIFVLSDYSLLQYSIINNGQNNANALYLAQEKESYLAALSKNESFINKILLYDDKKINLTQLTNYLNNLRFPVTVYQWINGSWISINNKYLNFLIPLFITNFTYNNITNYSLGLAGIYPGETAIYHASKCIVSYPNGSKTNFIKVYNETPSLSECTVYALQGAYINYYILEGYNQTSGFLGKTELFLGYSAIISTK
ncbi:MAG: hypothetical protein QXL76_00460 [Candidatus Rehaiarchaeum fermentans]|nr:hypothetical protein [Candidatus Rehaiarchaeum fermentans]